MVKLFQNYSTPLVLCLLTGCSASFKAEDAAILGELTTEGATTAAPTGPDQGAWDLNQTFPGSGVYTGVTNLPLAADLCSTLTAAGVTGTAVCQATAGGTISTASQVLTGTYFWDATGVSTAGTMPYGSNQTGADGAATITLPAGYYDGSFTATFQDSDLAPGNISNGVVIMGVTGNANLESHANCTANGQSGCVANASFVAGAPAPTNANGANGTAAITVPVGYYDGVNNTITAADTDLLAANIRAGVVVFGVTGDSNVADTSSGDAVAAEIRNGKIAWVDGAQITGSMADQTLSAASTTVNAGYYNATTLDAVDGDLIAGNIRGGVTLFGVTGDTNVANTSTGDAIAGEILLGKKAWVDGLEITGTLATQTLSDSSTTVVAGNYAATTLDAVDADLITTNIRSGVTIFGVAGNANVVNSSSGDAVAGEIRLGKKAWVDGTEVTGTMPEGNNVTGADGAVSVTIPAGYYDGSETLTVSDSDLVAGNIVNPANIFGTAGTLAQCSAANQTGCVATVTYASQSTPATPATAALVLNGKEFYAGGALITGTLSAQSLSDSSTTVTAGSYSATTLTAVDSDLVTGNIRSGVTIFGVAGNSNVVNTSSGDATAAHVLAGKKLWVDGSEITGTLANNGTWNLTQSFATAGGAGYFSATSNPPAAGTICTSTTIAGVPGTANCAGISLASNQHRDILEPQVSLTTEAVTNAATLYTNGAGYRAVTVISKDWDVGGNSVDRTGWSTTTCGTSGTIAARIADCATTFGANATWSGSTKGISGEGTWKLVTRTGDIVTDSVTEQRGREVWRDERTGLLWSSKVSNALNWCQASGINNNAANPLQYSDASYCDLNISGVSACYEDDGTYFSQVGTDQNGKAGLGYASTPRVGWRLPTRNDYLQAQVNGIKYVLPDYHPQAAEWTSTTVQSNSNNAWGFYGFMSYSARNTSWDVRCVGR